MLSTTLVLAQFRASIRSLSTTSQMLMRTTPILCAEPLKKKKKIDPAVVKAREERKRKKLEKQIRRLEKNARQLKPIDELETPLTLIDEKNKRSRPLPEISPAVTEERTILQKNWSRYKMEEKLKHFQKIDQMMLAQEKALQELRFESEDLYQEAIQPDLELIPYTTRGPVATPPVENFNSPDGEYINISKKWN